MTTKLNPPSSNKPGLIFSSNGNSDTENLMLPRKRKKKDSKYGKLNTTGSNLTTPTQPTVIKLKLANSPIKLKSIEPKHADYKTSKHH
jgi:hypothetical protein